jgi:hypothetical protein
MTEADWGGSATRTNLARSGVAADFGPRSPRVECRACISLRKPAGYLAFQLGDARAGLSAGFARTCLRRVPNCERCLVPMVIEGADDGQYWCCPECRIVRLA